MNFYRAWLYQICRHQNIQALSEASKGKILQQQKSYV
ncbi:hypothetical protein EMIT0P43_30163 [Pseudomonas jessenii]